MIPDDKTERPVKDIILRFLEGVATDEEVVFLRNWLAKHEANRRYFDEVNATFQASITLNRLNHQRVDSAWERLSQKLDGEKTDIPPKSSGTMYFSAWKIAASVILVIAAGISVFDFFHDTKTNQKGTIVRNAQGNNTRIVLPDSTLVWLNTNSSLEYQADFGEEIRQVTLKGEAFFDVKKGKKDFVVQTEKMQVHVKGTRFNVEAYKNSHSVKTTLEEGKVELHVEGEGKPYTMIPGDQVIVNTELSKVTRKKVNPLDFSAWKEEKLVFDDVPLTEVIARIENRYKVNIQVNSGRARRERLTLTIEQESLEEVLESLSLSSRLQVRTEKDKIVLYE